MRTNKRVLFSVLIMGIIGGIAFGGSALAQSVDVQLGVGVPLGKKDAPGQTKTSPGLHFLNTPNALPPGQAFIQGGKVTPPGHTFTNLGRSK